MASPEIESSPIRVQTLDHVTIVVKDLERSRKFYVDMLGMQQVERPGFRFDGRWFQAGETQIHLILEHDESGTTEENVAARQTSSRNHHFAFRVDDAQAADARLEKLGANFIGRAKQRPDGAVQVFVSDPDGHVVELCSPPTQATP